MASITITDVARRARVSMKTVSRVMNGEPYVREELRQRVRQAAQDLRYRPKVSARSLAGARAYVVGYLLTGLSPYVVQAQSGILKACHGAGYRLMVEAVDPAAPDLPAEIERIVGDLGVDGMILVPPLCDNAAILDALDRQGAAYVRLAPAEGSWPLAGGGRGRPGRGPDHDAPSCGARPSPHRLHPGAGGAQRLGPAASGLPRGPGRGGAGGGSRSFWSPATSPSRPAATPPDGCWLCPSRRPRSSPPTT